MTNPVHEFIRHVLDALDRAHEEMRKWSETMDQLHAKNLALHDRIRELEQKRD